MENNVSQIPEANIRQFCFIQLEKAYDQLMDSYRKYKTNQHNEFTNIWLEYVIFWSESVHYWSGRLGEEIEETNWFDSTE